MLEWKRMRMCVCTQQKYISYSDILVKLAKCKIKRNMYHKVK